MIPCEIKWLDAWHSQSDYTLKEVKTLKAHPTTSIGYLIKHDDKVCIICQSTDKDKSLSEVLIIPSGMVTGVKEL